MGHFKGVYWSRTGTKQDGVVPVGMAVMTDEHADHWLSFKQHTLIPNSPDTAASSGLKLQTIVRLRLQNYLVRFRLQNYLVVFEKIERCLDH